MAGREASPSAGVIDSQWVETTEAAGPRRYHAGKRIKGRKRHLMTATIDCLSVSSCTRQTSRTAMAHLHCSPASAARFPGCVTSLPMPAKLAASPVDAHYRWRPQLSDAGDELVFEAAVNGRADALVTYNIRQFATASVRFGLRIVRPVEVLEEMTR